MIKKISFILFLVLIAIGALIGLDGDAFTRFSAIACYAIGSGGCIAVLLYHLKTTANN